MFAPDKVAARQNRNSEQTRKIIELTVERRKGESIIVDVLGPLGKQGVKKSILRCLIPHIRQGQYLPRGRQPFGIRMRLHKSLRLLLALLGKNGACSIQQASARL